MSKRKSEVLSTSSETSKPHKRAKQQSTPVIFFALRVSALDEESKGQFMENKQQFEVWLRQHCVQWVFQLEQGEEKGRMHFQCNVKTRIRRRKEELKNKLISYFPKRSVYLEPSASPVDYQEYCQKKATRLEGPWADKPIRPPYQGEDLFTNPLPWQATILNSLEQKADQRVVNWIYDPVGSTGKTALCKYLGYHQKAVVLGYAKSADLMHLVSQFKDAPAYFFDLTRCKPTDYSSNDLYSTIESIKNGVILSTKYQPSVHYQAPAHVWCFSNVMPTLSALSADRWTIWKVTSSHDPLVKI